MHLHGFRKVISHFCQYLSPKTVFLGPLLNEFTSACFVKRINRAPRHLDELINTGVSERQSGIQSGRITGARMIVHVWHLNHRLDTNATSYFQENHIDTLVLGSKRWVHDDSIKGSSIEIVRGIEARFEDLEESRIVEIGA